MIARGDAVLAVSNSGETAEMNAIVEHKRRNGVPLVAIVGRAPTARSPRAPMSLSR